MKALFIPSFGIGIYLTYIGCPFLDWNRFGHTLNQHQVKTLGFCTSSSPSFYHHFFSMRLYL